MRFGFKRSYSSREAADKVRKQQKDPGLVIYTCPTGAGWHLGHRPDARPATDGHPTATPQGLESHRFEAHMPPELQTSLRKEFSMKMNVTLGNPFLIAIYSASLLLIGCGVGIHWAHTPATALRLAIAGGVLMALHDTATGVLWFWLTARWAHSMIERKDR